MLLGAGFAMAENKSEMACVYAALILHDDGVPITVRSHITWNLGSPIVLVPGWGDLCVGQVRHAHDEKDHRC